jgi:hypothetical protein
VPALHDGRIRHTVSFALRHPEGSAEETAFLDAATKLGGIPGVEAFEVLREVSPENGFRLGTSTEVADADASSGSNEHPDRGAFVENRWIPEVADFLEVDDAARVGWRR